MGFSAITSFGLKVAEEGAYQNALKNIANNAATQPISS
jgi:hypothetical protein